MISPLGEEIFTVEEAAAFAKVTESKIKSWLDLGLKHLPTANNANRTGPRAVIMRKSALLEFIMLREVGAKDSATDPKKDDQAKRELPVIDDRHGLMKRGKNRAATR